MQLKKKVTTDMFNNAICIVNYNGNYDTIECLESLFNNIDMNLNRIFILDNGSENINYSEFSKSLSVICNRYKLNYVVNTNEGNVKKNEAQIFLFRSEENLGFAGGNNFLLKIAIENEFEYCTLLNNDTLVEDSGIDRIVSCMEQKQHIGVCTANICYNDKRDVTWNAGGKLFWGHRFYYSTKQINNWLKQDKKTISTEFLSGCFMMIRADVLRKYGLLSNDFFFGEEDFEFSSRLKRNGVMCISFLDSKIYHKVSSSAKRHIQDHDSAIISYWVNRYIDIRKQFGKGVKWVAWESITTLLLFFKYWIALRNRKSAKEIIRRVIRISRNNDKMSKELTVKMWNNEA